MSAVPHAEPERRRACAEAQLSRRNLLGGLGLGFAGTVSWDLLELDPSSYLPVEPTWQPTLPSRTPGDFRITDLLRFAGVDPASRGQ